jgi:hypothetical protein
VADELAAARDDWWVLGGTAVALHGLPIEIADIDILLSARDLGGLMARLGLEAERGTTTERIRSDLWLPWKALPLGVDFMAGLQVRQDGQWRRIEPRTREAVRIAGRAIHVPMRPELIEILQLFGRPKDLERAEGLARLG